MGGGGDSCAPIFGSNEPNFCTAESHTVEDTNPMDVCIFQKATVKTENIPHPHKR